MFFLVLLVHGPTTKHTLSQKSRGAKKGQRENKRGQAEG